MTPTVCSLSLDRRDGLNKTCFWIIKHSIWRTMKDQTQIMDITLHFLDVYSPMAAFIKDILCVCVSEMIVSVTLWNWRELTFKLDTYAQKPSVPIAVFLPWPLTCVLDLLVQLMTTPAFSMVWWHHKQKKNISDALSSLTDSLFLHSNGLFVRKGLVTPHMKLISGSVLLAVWKSPQLYISNKSTCFADPIH